MGGLSQDPLTPVSQERETEAQKGKASYPVVPFVDRNGFITGQRAAPQSSLTLTTFQDRIISQKMLMTLL